ncbi:MAG: hypothetical protein IRY96_03285 [Burkholderiales bacterium]|nr:hypothetical protein [Burkholderiales bacterium]
MEAAVTDTAMAAAFEQAGYVPPEARLRAAAESAIARGSMSAALSEFERAVRRDPEMLIALVGAERRRSIMSAYLSQVARDTRSRGEAGQRPCVTHDPVARPVAAPTRRGIEAIALAAPTVARSLLRTFLVNGQPLAEVTVEEATSWARSRERDARFVRLLTEGLPPGAVIGRYVTDEDAERAYRLAEEAANA